MSAYDADALPASTKGALDGALVVTVPRAARILDVSRAQMYNLMTRGQLRWIKLGRSRRIEISELERLIAASRVEA